MKKLKKGIVIALALCMALGIFSGCDNSNDNATNSPSASPSTSASASPSADSDELGAEETAINADKERVKLTMVLSSSGLTIPDGVDINDNAWTNAIKE